MKNMILYLDGIIIIIASLLVDCERMIDRVAGSMIFLLGLGFVFWAIMEGEKNEKHHRRTDDCDSRPHFLP